MFKQTKQLLGFGNCDVERHTSLILADITIYTKAYTFAADLICCMSSLLLCCCFTFTVNRYGHVGTFIYPNCTIAVQA